MESHNTNTVDVEYDSDGEVVQKDIIVVLEQINQHKKTCTASSPCYCKTRECHKVYHQLQKMIFKCCCGRSNDCLTCNNEYAINGTTVSLMSCLDTSGSESTFIDMLKYVNELRNENYHLKDELKKYT